VPPKAPTAGPTPPGASAAPKPPGAATPPKPPGSPAAAPKVPSAPGAAKPAAAPAPPPEPVDPNSPEALIAQVPVFKDVPPALRRTLVEEGAFRVLAPKAVICKEGEYTADFYVVLSGLVGVYKQSGETQKYLASLPANSWFGEMSCMSNAPRSATVVAEADAVVLSVPRHAFMKVYGDKKAASFKKMVDAVYKDRSIALHLSSVSLFRGIKESVLKKVADVAQLVVAEKGETIVKEGDPGDAFFLIRTGHAKVVRGDEILAWLCENSFFGEVALIEDAPRRSTVAAVDRMDLVKIPKAPFLELLDEFPEVKATVLDRARRIYEEEFLTDEETAARVRAREIGTEHEVVKAGEALVIDMSKCTRCNMCVEGCVEAHEDRIPRIGKRGIQYGDLLLTSSCYNCKVPDCMLACKFGAIRRDRRGQVIIDPEACTGCALCEPACPYGTIHMQSLVGDESLEVVASPISTFLSKIPGLSALAKPKAIAKKERQDETAETGGKKRLRMAVKCDLCSGRADMACIYNCPCGAIERIDPSILLG